MDTKALSEQEIELSRTTWNGHYEGTFETWNAIHDLALSAKRNERDAERYKAAIEWALGMRGDFPSRGPDDPAYYWRKQLRTLAFGKLEYNAETKTITAAKGSQ